MTAKPSTMRLDAPVLTWTTRPATSILADASAVCRSRQSVLIPAAAAQGACPQTHSHATTPRRIQLRRVKGWRLPANTVVVARPGRWGNPFPIQPGFRDRATALALYAQLINELGEPFRAEVRRHLAGRNLACWCPLDVPCHADLLLEIANPHAGDEAGAREALDCIQCKILPRSFGLTDGRVVA